ncbi:EGF domain-specific O-linked N-acetylglucosamine transferase-like [Haliotis cracherodii]|uniref:EGF domain-specific O-linked N-acetylglucosamine transferase-like n=1 Tax=Haliotis cracherodii TaxID=6455 RepID=UPI0039ECA2DF
MASIFIRVNRMFRFKCRPKHLCFVSLFGLCVIVLYKMFVLLTSPPHLYKVAMATMKENYVIKEDADDNAECSKHIQNINSYVVIFHDVIIDPKKSIKMRWRPNQLKLEKGFFTVPCVGDSPLVRSTFYGGLSPFASWVTAIDITSYARNKFDEIDAVEGSTIVIKRKHTNNVYLKILDMYNTYVTVRMMRQKPKDVYILLIDAHSDESSVNEWNVVFGEATQIKDIPKKLKYENVVWGIPDGLGPIATYDLPLPFLDDFRHHVVTSGGAVTSDDIVCPGLRISILAAGLKTDSQTGKVLQHSISNSDDITEQLHREFSDCDLMIINTESMSMRQQIQAFAKTDILIGPHGHDLANTVFLHQGAGLIELFPTRYKFISDTRFRQLAAWSKVYYSSWFNLEMMFRDSEVMTVDPSVVIDIVKGMRRILCSK